MRYIISIVILLFAAPSFADGVYWTNGFDSVQYSTPSDACQALVVLNETDASKNYPYHDTRLYATRVDPGLMAARCDIYTAEQQNKDIYDAQHADYPNSWRYWGPIVFRHGDCTPPAVFDQATGTCKTSEEDKCKSLSGTSKAFSKSGTAPDGYMVLVGKTAAAKQSGCFDGCLASTADQKCTTKVSGPYFCRGTAWFTGEACDTSGTPGVDSSTSSEYPDPKQTEENKPCSYAPNSDGTQSCTSEKSKETEGQVCGTVSATGEQICVDKPPSKNGLQIDTTVKTEVDPDGGTKTTKTDKATTTQCSAIKSCTTSTTTVTTVINGKGNTTSTCTGANCPDKSTNPDGDGDGFGDCATGDCGESGGGSDPGLSKFDDVDDYGTTLQKFYEKATSSPLATSVKSLSIASGGFCTAQSYDLGYVGVQDASFFCTFLPQLLIPLRVVFLAIWAWAAIRLFMTA
jgi:hypothetical protein